MSKVSYEVQKRYRDKALRRITIDLPKELSEQWENKLKSEGVTKSGFINQSIAEYLAQKPE